MVERAFVDYWRNASTSPRGNVCPRPAMRGFEHHLPLSRLVRHACPPDFFLEDVSELRTRRVNITTVAELKVAELEAEVSRLRARMSELEAAASTRKIWRVGELQKQVEERANRLELPQNHCELLRGLVKRLHDVALRHGFECVPPPQVDISGEEIELTWVNLRRRRSVSVWIDDSAPSISWSEEGRGGDTINPPDELIARRMAWVIGA